MNDLLKIYEAVDSLSQNYIPTLNVAEEVNGIYAVRGLVYDLIVNFGYQDEYDKWALERHVNSGMARKEDMGYINKRLAELEGKK